MNATGSPDNAARVLQIEQEISEIFRHVLQREEVARDASFFDIGGNSLSATKVASALRERFNLPSLGLRVFFRGPTVEALARAIADLSPSPSSG